MDEKLLEELRLKAELAESTHWKKIKEITSKQFVELSLSNLDPVEYKSLFKFIAIVDTWVDDYNKVLEQLRQKQ